MTVIICLSETSPFSCWRQDIVMFLWFYLNILRQQWRPFWPTFLLLLGPGQVQKCLFDFLLLQSQLCHIPLMGSLYYSIFFPSLDRFEFTVRKLWYKYLCFKINSLCQVWHLRHLYSSTTAIKVDIALSQIH